MMMKLAFIYILFAGCAGCTSSIERLTPAAVGDGTTQPPVLTREASKVGATGNTLTDRQVRGGIALAVEKNLVFRTLLDGGAPKLLNAKIVGPVGTTKLSDNGVQETLYCVSAEIEQPLSAILPAVRYASVKVFKTVSSSKATLLVQAFISSQRAPGCGAPGFVPFPEAEQARDARRKARAQS
jgi:hypothetical protein